MIFLSYKNKKSYAFLFILEIVKNCIVPISNLGEILSSNG